MHQDQRYIDGLLKNDHTTIKEIYTRFSARIKALVLKNNGTADDVCDLFQEALIAIHRNAAAGLVLECPFEAYLYLICKRKWLNQLKKNRPHGVTIRDLEGYERVEEELGPLQELQTEREELFWQVFQDLGDICKALLRLAWSDLSMQEVALKMGMTYGYARRRKTLCTQQLMEMVRNSPSFTALKEL